MQRQQSDRAKSRVRNSPIKEMSQRCVIVIKIIRLRLRLRLYELVLGNRNRLQLPLFFVRLNRLQFGVLHCS